jgi:hypothetical protein
VAINTQKEDENEDEDEDAGLSAHSSSSSSSSRSSSSRSENLSSTRQPHAPHPKLSLGKEHEKATAFQRTNASAFSYAGLSLSALMVDTAVVVATMQMTNCYYDPSTPQYQNCTAVDTAARVVDEDPH